MAARIGRRTVRFDRPPSVAAWASVAGKQEAAGPLGPLFDRTTQDTTFGCDTWEQAESTLVGQTVALLLEKSGHAAAEIDCIFAGDLLNQCIASSFGLRALGIPVFGLYSACSTISEGITLASLLVESGAANLAAAAASSHFCAAERQYRSPLEYGGVRPPTSQWTATACGALLFAPNEKPPYVRAVTFPMIEDLGVTDQNNMGAAMAPAAAATLLQFFSDTGLAPADFDAVITGDLGAVGSELLLALAEREGLLLLDRHQDCGKLLFDRDRQDVHAGGSGAGCSAAVLAANFLPALAEGSLQNVLFLATGALLSTTSVQQGESIPAIAHLAWLSHETGGGL